MATDHSTGPQPSGAAHGEDNSVPLPTPVWEPGVLAALYEVAFEQPTSESVGVLVGLASITVAAPRVSAIIPASARQPQGQAHLDHAAWSYIYSAMAKHYPGLDIVGWWVSRPAPPTTLGPAELASAADAFGKPGRFGYVFDSIHRRAAFYRFDGVTFVLAGEQQMPRELTRSRPTRRRQIRAALSTFAIGVVAGAIAWIALGAPGLSLGAAYPYTTSLS